MAAIATSIAAAAIAAASLSLAADSTGADPPAASTPRLVVPLQLRWWVPPGLEAIDRLLATGHFYPSMGWL